MTNECRIKARRRAEGIRCPICRLGPCTRELETTRAVRMLPHTIPNRLHGAAINAEGDAI